MIISHQKKFIFLANGKTGTTTLQATLQEYQDGPELVCHAEGYFNAKHIPAAILRELVPRLDWCGYFKFGFVRHPVDRFLSVWKHYNRLNELDPKRLLRHPRSTLQVWHHSLRRDVPPIPKVIEEEHVRRIIANHADSRLKVGYETNLQYPMFYDSKDELCVDFIGRYETLDADVAAIAERLRIPVPKLPRLNVGKGKRERVKFSPRAEELLRATYAEDFQRFNYDFDATLS